MENARINIFVNYMRATEIETKGTSCPQYFTYCCIFFLYIYESSKVLRAPARSKGARVRVHNLAPFGERGGQGGGGCLIIGNF
jgi:hypothetical protein